MNSLHSVSLHQPSFGAKKRSEKRDDYRPPKKPLGQRLKARGRRVGDLPMAFGTLLVLSEALPGKQDLWKFGTLWLLIGGARKAFNRLGEVAAGDTEKARTKLEMERGRRELENIDSYRDFYFPDAAVSAQMAQDAEDETVERLREELDHIEEHFPEEPEE